MRKCYNNKLQLKLFLQKLISILILLLASIKVIFLFQRLLSLHKIAESKKELYYLMAGGERPGQVR